MEGTGNSIYILSFYSGTCVVLNKEYERSIEEKEIVSNKDDDRKIFEDNSNVDMLEDKTKTDQSGSSLPPIDEPPPKPPRKPLPPPPVETTLNGEIGLEDNFEGDVVKSSFIAERPMSINEYVSFMKSITRKGVHHEYEELRSLPPTGSFESTL